MKIPANSDTREWTESERRRVMELLIPTVPNVPGIWDRNRREAPNVPEFDRLDPELVVTLLFSMQDAYDHGRQAAKIENKLPRTT